MKFFLAVVIGTYDESLFTGDAIKIIMSMAEYFELKYATSLKLYCVMPSQLNSRQNLNYRHDFAWLLHVTCLL